MNDYNWEAQDDFNAAFERMADGIKKMQQPLDAIARTLSEISRDSKERLVRMQLREDIMEMGIIDGTVTVSISPR